MYKHGVTTKFINWILVSLNTGQTPDILIKQTVLVTTVIFINPSHGDPTVNHLILLQMSTGVVCQVSTNLYLKHDGPRVAHLSHLDWVV